MSDPRETAREIIRFWRIKVGAFAMPELDYYDEEHYEQLATAFAEALAVVERQRDEAVWRAHVPVTEGGGACGLENYRTLCLWCHARETGTLRRRLNAAKRK